MPGIELERRLHESTGNKLRPIYGARGQFPDTYMWIRDLSKMGITLLELAGIPQMIQRGEGVSRPASEDYWSQIKPNLPLSARRTITLPVSRLDYYKPGRGSRDLNIGVFVEDNDGILAAERLWVRERMPDWGWNADEEPHFGIGKARASQIVEGILPWLASKMPDEVVLRPVGLTMPRAK